MNVFLFFFQTCCEDRSSRLNDNMEQSWRLIHRCNTMIKILIAYILVILTVCVLNKLRFILEFSVYNKSHTNRSIGFNTWKYQEKYCQNKRQNTSVDDILCMVCILVSSYVKSDYNVYGRSLILSKIFTFIIDPYWFSILSRHPSVVDDIFNHCVAPCLLYDIINLGYVE